MREPSQIHLMGGGTPWQQWHIHCMCVCVCITYKRKVSMQTFCSKAIWSTTAEQILQSVLSILAVNTVLLPRFLTGWGEINVEARRCCPLAIVIDPQEGRLSYLGVFVEPLRSLQMAYLSFSLRQLFHPRWTSCKNVSGRRFTR